MKKIRFYRKKHNPTHNYENNAKNEKKSKIGKGKNISSWFFTSILCLYCFLLCYVKLENEALYGLWFIRTNLDVELIFGNSSIFFNDFGYNCQKMTFLISSAEISMN